MKNFKIAALILFSGLPAYAGVTNVEEVMRTVDAQNVSTLEELLPQLPRELRTHFTMVHTSRSLQAASLAHPRIIMFGKDAKFVAAFNGDPTARGFNVLEMFQFNEADKKFEFFELEFPVKRDAQGRAVRPEKNPARCLECHGSDPHPIWSRYNNWPGFFGSGDDFLEGAELAAMETFLKNRGQSARYRHLEPMAGSALSPFSYEKRGNFQFRPNLQAGLLFSRLQAKKIARQIRETGRAAKFIPLIAYEIDRGGVGGVGYDECPSLLSPAPILDGLWKPENAKQLRAKLDELRLSISPGSQAVPEAWDLVKDLHFLFSSLNAGEWSMDLEPATAALVEFVNGNSPLRSQVITELLPELERALPGISESAVYRYRLVEDPPNQRLVRTPWDFDFLKLLDAMNVRVSFKSEDQEHCKRFIGEIKKAWF